MREKNERGEEQPSTLSKYDFLFLQIQLKKLILQKKSQIDCRASVCRKPFRFNYYQ